MTKFKYNNNCGQLLVTHRSTNEKKNSRGRWGDNILLN